jgi:hypothetical protein
MTEHTPRAIAVAFTKAWSSHDLLSAAAYLAEDVVFDAQVATRWGPLGGPGPISRA